MVEIVISVAAKISEYLVAPVIHPFTYLCNYKSNFENLKNEIGKLRVARESVLHRVDDAKRNGEDIEQKVEKWLSDVDKIMDAAGQIIEDEERAKCRCFKGLCPNLTTCYQLSKRAAKEVMVIARVVQEEGKFDKVSYSTIPEDIWMAFIKGYEAFESRKSTLNDVLNALNNSNVNMIGVYGMAGVGKTMLVKEVARLAKKDKLFDEVVFAEVFQISDIKKIQGQISDKMGLKFYEESESGRARRLCERLKKEKKILVILDNIWASLDFEKVGIPFGDNHKGCKVLMTARNQDVLSIKMDCQNNFLVGVLNEREAWNLFKKIAGDYVENEDLQSIAKDIAKACGGLPIAIVTIARALRNKSVFEWENALQELRRPSARNFTGVPAEAYSTIELSYNHLEGEELKSTFLLCSLMVHIHSATIPYLLIYGMGLGLFGGMDTIEEAQNRVHMLINKLKTSCLLLDGHTSQEFSMHDVVRDVAISIAFRDQDIFSMNDGVFPRGLSDKEALKRCPAISLHNCKIGELLEGLECPQLKLLHMATEDLSVQQIPDNFFIGMTELRVLDFDAMHLPSLPSSLCLLLNLQTLCLDYGVFGDVSIIGELKTLEILSFQGSNIEELPREIAQLTRLRLLNLAFCNQLKLIPSNVLSSLSRLEELYMGDTFIEWEIEGLNIVRSKASLHELKHLSRLTNLEIHIQDAYVLPKGLLSKKLKRYKIFIGDEWNWSDRLENSRILKLKLNNSIWQKDEVFLQLKGIEELYLDEMQGVKNIVYDLDREGFPKLKHLQIQNNSYFQYVIDSMKHVPRDAFRALESLSLRNLINLEKICHGKLKAESFCKLTTLKVKSCDKLSFIFSFSIARGLSQLQTIEVIACKNMKEIFAVVREDDIKDNGVIDKLEFGQLRKLTLKSLSHLRSFCSVLKKSYTLERQQALLTTGASSNEVILEDELHTSAPFFSEKVAFPNLESLKLSAINFEKMWHDQLPAMSSSIQNLTRLIVRGCGTLKSLFQSSLVRSFVQLRHLEISSCMDLEQIVFLEESMEEEKDIIFPQLNFLKIKDLANLTRFCSGNYIEFPSLKELQIERCPVLKAFIFKNITTDLKAGKEVETISSVEIQPFFNEKVSLPCLEEMVLSNMDNLKMIWLNQFTGDSFCKLKLMKVESCKRLLTIFPPQICGRFLKLEFLMVTNCGSLEEIFDLQGMDFEETRSGAVTQLRDLYLSHLPKLKSIWNEDPHKMFSSLNLLKLRIFACQSLKSLFPASIASSLLQLEKLYIKNCGMEEIVANEGRAEATVRFVFPSLTSLRLWELPHLRTFYRGMHTLEWPVLKKLKVYGCDKVRMFVLEHISFEELNGIPAEQTHFFDEKVFPNLEELSLSKKDIIMIWQDHFPEHLFWKLKVFHVTCDDESAFFPLGLLQSFHNLEKLVLSYSSYKEICSSEEVEKHAGRLAHIKTLKLNKLSDLTHIWKQDSKLDFMLQNLEILEIKYCGNMMNLVPSRASFQNLTALDVCDCERLVSLVTSSTAKSLVQLRKMRISKCKMIAEVIVSDQGDVVKDEIVFNKLKQLFLDSLERLRSFCSGANYAFNFPYLEDLVMIKCPNMKIFSAGVLRTPRLWEVQNMELNEAWWAGDLNTTIQQLHEKLARRPKIKDSGESETSTSEETDDEKDEEGSEENEFPATSEDEEESETSMSEEIDEEEDKGNIEEEQENGDE